MLRMGNEEEVGLLLPLLPVSDPTFYDRILFLVTSLLCWSLTYANVVCSTSCYSRLSVLCTVLLLNQFCVTTSEAFVCPSLSASLRGYINALLITSLEHN